MKNHIFIMLLLLITILFFQYYKQKQIKEDFADSYLKNFKSYINNIKISNDDNNARLKGKQEKKDRKFKTKKDIEKEKILITGATSGLGYYIAKYVNQYKPKLFISGKNEKKVKQIVEDLSRYNPNVYGIHADFTKKKGVTKLYNEVIYKMKNVSILINATHIKKGSQLLFNKNEKDFRDEMDVNVNATIILSQKFGNRMSIYKTRGRIINFSSYRSKNTKVNYSTTDKILFENIIENFSSVFSQEMHRHGIAVTTIRMDKLFNFNKNGNKLFDVNSTIGKTLGSVFYTSPKKLIPMLDYALRAPNSDISGKVLSTDNFYNNKDLMGIVSPNKLENDYKLFKNVTMTKTIPRNKIHKTKLIAKQNPYPYSPEIKKMLSSKHVFNTYNTGGKYDTILDNIISKKLVVNRKQIIFFKSEYDAIKKLLEMFVSKGNEVLTTNSPLSYLQLASIENKSTVEVTTLNNTYDRFLDINYSNFKYLPRTKMVYLSSPNHISGLCIRENSRWKMFLSKLPENVVLVIDQRYIDFVDESDIKTGDAPFLDAITLLKKRKNTIVLRSFNNFYSIENLELAYTISSKEISSLFRNSQMINQIDYFSEKLALTVINDKYYQDTKKKIINQRKVMLRKLEKNNIDFYDSDANFFLVNTTSSKSSIMNDLEKEEIILYNSNESFNSYWTLPISTADINNQVLEIILYDNMENV